MILSPKEIKAILKERIPEGIVVAAHTEDGHFYKFTPTNVICPSVTTITGILGEDRLKVWAAGLAVDYFFEKIQQNGIPDMAQYPQLKNSAVLVHKELFEDAGSIGTVGHGFIEAYLKEWIQTETKPDSILTFNTSGDPRAFAIIRSAEKFFTDFEMIPIASEMKIFSTKYGYAGTLDSIMLYHKEIEAGNNPECVHHYLTKSKRLKLLQCFHCNRVVTRRLAIVDFKTSNSIMKPAYAIQVTAYEKALKEMTRRMITIDDIIIVRLDKFKMKYEALLVNKWGEAFSAFSGLIKAYNWLNNGTEKLFPFIPKQIISLTTPQYGRASEGGLSEV